MLKDSTINKSEINKFTVLAKEWWNENGKFKTLHEINPIRIQFIKKNIIQHFKKEDILIEPLANLNILDVGCGAGLLSVPIRRLGANVIGIDPVRRNIKVAKQYIKNNKIKMTFNCCTTKNLLKDYRRYFDVVLNMEVIEHVNDVEGFLIDNIRLLKHNGIIFISTINKTLQSLFQAKFIAEYCLRWLPIGTHKWNKFIQPKTVIQIMKANRLKILSVTGVSYNLFQKRWYLSNKMSVNYIICFKKFSDHSENLL